MVTDTGVDGAALGRIWDGVAVTLEANKDYLCELDSEVGDGDHGVSMTIGMRAARRALSDLEGPTPETAFRAVSEAFADEVGASIGPLYEAAFTAAADVVEGQDAITNAKTWAAIISSMASAMQTAGKAQVGDKTLSDAFVPAAEAAKRSSDSGAGVGETLSAAAQAAQAGVEETKNLVPKLGRASRLGERARGFQDAGATSSSILLAALRDGVSGTG